MKRYLLFGYDKYYPLGGFDDLLGDFETLEEIAAEIAKNEHDYYDVYDNEFREIIKNPTP